MSTSSAADNLVSSLGAGVGGLMLLLYDHQGVGISLGAIGIAAATVFQLLASGPLNLKRRHVPDPVEIAES